MTKTEYIEKMIDSCELIYIDTASLMDVDRAEQFIDGCADILRNHSRKIIVPLAVCQELVRHLGSETSAKSDLALRAWDLIVRNRDIFQVENKTMTEEEIAKAFADANLLSELTLHKKDFSQLLITNDKKLSNDAFALNQQQSCRGYRINVCYINPIGGLQICDCAAEAVSSKAETADSDAAAPETDTSEAKTAVLPTENQCAPDRRSNTDAGLAQSRVHTPSTENKSKRIWPLWVVSGVAFVGGVLFEKYKPAIISAIKVVN